MYCVTYFFKRAWRQKTFSPISDKPGKITDETDNFLSLLLVINRIFSSFSDSFQQRKMHVLLFYKLLAI